VKLPSRNVGPWAKELIGECMVSRDLRMNAYRYYKSLYYTGSEVGNSADNMCYSHVDKLSSYLFSPADVRFDVSFLADEAPKWRGAADLAGQHLTREFRRNRCGLTFAQAVDVSLVKGCAIIKLVWDHNGYKPFVVQPERFGVLREDLEDLNDQDAFNFRYYLTPSEFIRMMRGDPKSQPIVREVLNKSPMVDSNDFEESYLHEIVAGGVNPIGTTQATGQRGNVAYTTTPAPQLSPEVRSKLICIDELWCMNDDARDGRGDWTTIRMAGDTVIDGEFYYRNLFDVPGEHGFTKVCPNEVPGYFWGRSELATVAGPQLLLNERMNDIDRIFVRQARPARAFTGFSSITDEKARILNTPGGVLTDAQAPQAKIESLAPTMPPIALEYIALIKRNFEEAGGFTPTTSGQGDNSVRSGAQANTLLRTSSPRLRDRALIVEDQCSTFASKCFALSQAKDARVFTVPKTGPINKMIGAVREFFLHQLPDDTQVSVDSHTSSPAFSGDKAQLAFALSARGAIDGKDLLRLTHPPYEDQLILAYEERAEQQAEFIKQHPELALEHKKGKK